MINHKQVIIKDFTMTDPNSVEYWTTPAIIPTATTAGKTYFLSEQIIDIDAKIKVEEVKPGKIFFPKLYASVSLPRSPNDDIEQNYQELQSSLGLIEQKILTKFLELIPDGKGIYYLFNIEFLPTDNNGISMTNKIAMIWAEKIKRG